MSSVKKTKKEFVVYYHNNESWLVHSKHATFFSAENAQAIVERLGFETQIDEETPEQMF